MAFNWYVDSAKASLKGKVIRFESLLSLKTIDLKKVSKKAWTEQKVLSSEM